MEFTNTEKRLLAILVVCGTVNRAELNTACNTDSIQRVARNRALRSLRQKGCIKNDRLRAEGEMWKGA